MSLEPLLPQRAIHPHSFPICCGTLSLLICYPSSFEKRWYRLHSGCGSLADAFLRLPGTESTQVQCHYFSVGLRSANAVLNPFNIYAGLCRIKIWKLALINKLDRILEWHTCWKHPALICRNVWLLLFLGGEGVTGEGFLHKSTDKNGKNFVA